jgi:hypothetical protein
MNYKQEGNFYYIIGFWVVVYHCFLCCGFSLLSVMWFCNAVWVVLFIIAVSDVVLYCCLGGVVHHCCQWCGFVLLSGWCCSSLLSVMWVCNAVWVLQIWVEYLIEMKWILVLNIKTNTTDSCKENMMNVWSILKQSNQK